MAPEPAWFLACALGLSLAAPLHVLSVRHSDLRRRHGAEGGARLGRAYAAASGTMESVFLVALWLAPQPRSWTPWTVALGLGPLAVRVGPVGLLVAAPLLATGAWLGLAGLRAVGLETADTHEPPSRLRTDGVYGIVRHPQYLGWTLAHVGASVLLSAWWALLFTPALLAIIYAISRAEEADLMETFGDGYGRYVAEVPMLLPRP
jgi:protein-S-isoprenylcysteine O-methyltransferase Ste14